MRKLVLEGGWVPKRLYDLGQTRTSVEAVTRKKAWRSTGCTVVRHGEKSATRRQSVFGELGTEDQDIEGGSDVAERTHVAPSEPLVSP